MSDTQNCPVCFRSIKKASKFCKFCGSTLKLCPECSFLNRGEDAYCSECGSDISTVEVAKSYRDKVQSVKTTTDQEIITNEFLEEGGFTKKG